MKVKILLLAFICLFVLIVSGCSKSFPVIHKDRSIAITINIKDMTLSFIDLDKEEMIETWTMDKPYSGGVILPDGDSLILYGKQVETVDKYSLQKGKKIESWEIGKGIVSGVFLPETNELVLSDQQRKSVRFIDLEGKQTEEVTKTGNPLALLSSNNSLYVVSYDSKKLSIIDIHEKKIMKQFVIHPSATGAIVQEEKQEIWIGGHGQGTELGSDIFIYDSISGDQKKKISAPVMPINLLKDSEGIFVLSHGSNSLYKMSDDGQIEGKLVVGANPFEMAEYKEELLVAGYDSNDIHFITKEGLNNRKTVKVGKGPFQIIIRESN